MTQRYRPGFGSIAALVYLLALAGQAALSQEKKPEPKAVEATKFSGFSDSGAFQLYINEEPLIHCDFTWKDDGTFDNTTVTKAAGQEVRTRFQVACNKEGRWVKIVYTTPGETIAMQRDGEKMKITSDKNPEGSFPLKPGLLFMENGSPALMSLAIRAYDGAKGGKQAMPTLVFLPGRVPQLEATWERKDTVQRSAAGKDLKFTRYNFRLASTEMVVWADAAGKIYLVQSPAQKISIVREGYEALNQPEVVDPLLSKPEFEVKEETNLRVPMRDGVKLAIDVYRPKREGKAPAILYRTPYKKDIMRLKAMFYARRGYVVAVEDCRGRFGSGGTWEPFINEPKDGYDTIEWLAEQPWCNGKIGMIGASYGGWVQWWAAREGPPHLVTMIANVSPPDPFFNLPYEYGVFTLFASVWWAEIVESEATADVTGQKRAAVSGRKYSEVLKKLPVIDLDKEVFGKETPYWRRWIEHSSNDDYWAKANFLDRLDKVRIPVFHQSGWFDGDGIGTKLNYARMTALDHPNQKLVLGPWDHQDIATRTRGEHDFGPQTLRDLPRDYLRWFDYWLKGTDNGLAKEPLVSIFVMNTNKWLQGPKYPLPGTRFEKWYLSGGGKANTAAGDGKLQREPPSKDSPVDHYRYDPADPTPAPDLLIPEAAPGKKPAGWDRRAEVLKDRRDVLVYVSEPFDKPYTFAGPVSAVLYAASSAKDTDWFMRLMTVDDKGKVFPLVEGKIRARFRKSMSKPELLEPNQVYEYALDLWQTGITVPKGQRLRVEIASASFPNFSRNLNTGGHNETETKFVAAEQTIYHDAQHPSHVVVPMIPEEMLKK